MTTTVHARARREARPLAMPVPERSRLLLPTHPGSTVRNEELVMHRTIVCVAAVLWCAGCGTSSADGMSADDSTQGAASKGRKPAGAAGDQAAATVMDGLFKPK